MSRKKLKIETQTQVLLNSRRRCALCFGLYRDFRIKQGQIAHLDKNSENDKIENLEFLCLEHHDQYDGRTSQSKGLTIDEVLIFRDELRKRIKDDFEKPFLDDEKQRIDFVTGNYSTGSENISSYLEINYLGGNKIHVKGSSFYGLQDDYGPNMGFLDFVAEIKINKAIFEDELFDENYVLEIEFLGSKLKVTEKPVAGYFGHNVSFEGNYLKEI